MRWFNTLAIIVLFLVLLVINGQNSCMPQEECFSNTDCVKVQLTCCPCNMGGQERCIPRIMASVYEEKLKDCPPSEELICPALYNCEIEGCICDEGICTPVPESIE